MGKKEKIDSEETTERDEKVRTPRIKVQSCTEYDWKICNTHRYTRYASKDILITSFLSFKLYSKKHEACTLYRSLIIVIFIRDWTVDFYIFRENKVYAVRTLATRKKVCEIFKVPRLNYTLKKEKNMNLHKRSTLSMFAPYYVKSRP